METEETDVSEVLETPENVVEETTETPEPPTAEQIAKWKEMEKTNPQLYARAKKAEDDLKALKAQGAHSKESDGLSTKDVLYLAKADIHAEDVDEVLDYAKKMKVSVADAHKFYKPILTERAEERRTANASHTRGGARGTSKVSGEDLLRKADLTGEVPESAEGLQNLFAARMERRTK